MKPVLVKSNDEWLKLAPIMDKLGYKWIYTKESPMTRNMWNAFKMPFAVKIHEKHTISNTVNTEITQSVDEFIKTQPQQQ